MTVFSVESLDYLRAHHGVASGRALRRLGLSANDVRGLVDAGNLVPVLRGVYRMPAVDFDEPARCVAVCAAHPEAVISGPTAGRLWGLRRIPHDRRVHVLAPPASHPSIEPWVVPYRTRAFHPHDVVTRPDGIRVTGRPRTALDLTRFVTPTDLLSIIEQVMLEGDLDDAHLRATALDWFTPRRPFVRRFLETLDGRLRGGPAESHGEAVLGDALRLLGVRGLERQFRIDLPGYGPARFDLAVPDVRLAIEVDLHPTHHETNGRLRDEARDRAAEAIDWTVRRVVERHFGDNLRATCRELAQEIHRLQRQR
jgi:very-short-patch-repair endonuclease